MGAGADTIAFTLTIQNVGSGTQSYLLSIIPAGDRRAATIPYSLLINGDGARSPTLQYALTVVDVGLPVIGFTLTLADGHFSFGGQAPRCDVSSPFIITGKPNPPNMPTAPGDRVTGPAVPTFDWGSTFPIGKPSLPALHNQLARLSAQVGSMGATVNSLRNEAHKQTQPPKKDKNQQKPTDFTEIPGTRVTSKHRIFNPQDKTQYVDITQIDALKFQNKAGQTITWRR